MAERISVKDLERQAANLNRISGNADRGWVDGKAQIGHYYIDASNGGYALYQIMCDSGGVTTVLPRGTKKDLHSRLMAYIAGYATRKQEGNK